MQFTVGNSATMFNLDEKDRYEVALINQINNFEDNPIVFGATGFFQSTPYRTMECNRIYTLGLQQYSKKNDEAEKARQGLMRAFSEIDLQQVIFIKKKLNA